MAHHYEWTCTCGAYTPEPLAGLLPSLPQGIIPMVIESGARGHRR